MSCGGCSKKPSVSGHYTKARSGVLVADDTMTAAAMCTACTTRTEITCTVDGKSLRHHVKNLSCPSGKHPIEGIVYWFMNWYGVPFPIRKYLQWKGKILYSSSLPGCGCIKWIKDLWDSLARKTFANGSRKHH